MTNPDPRGGVPYTVGERVLYTEANLICSGIVNSIDGSAGGSYSPSTAITIAGSNGLIIGGTGSAQTLRYTSHQVQRAVTPPTATLNSASWTLPDSPHLWTTNTTTAGVRMMWHLNGLPNGGTIDTISFRFVGTTSGSFGGGETLPKFTLYKVDTDTGAETAVFAEVTDASAHAAYVVAHDISKTSIAHTIDLRAYWYYVVIKTPGGGNITAGATINSLLVTCSVISQNEYAA